MSIVSHPASVACSCRYSKWQIDSTARKLEQECLVERLQQLLQQDLQQSKAQTVSHCSCASSLLLLRFHQMYHAHASCDP